MGVSLRMSPNSPVCVQMFYDKVMQKADVVQATGDAITVFEELQVLTPRCIVLNYCTLSLLCIGSKPVQRLE